jgi:hypothetical protein
MSDPCASQGRNGRGSTVTSPIKPLPNIAAARDEMRRHSLLLCAKGARLAHAAGDRGSETLFDALQAMNLVFMLAISGNPMLQTLQDTMPYLMLVTLAIFLARMQPGFTKLRRAAEHPA